MKRGSLIVAACLAVAVLASGVSAWLQPSADEVARQRCVDEGWKEQDLALKGFRRLSGPAGLNQHAAVIFVTKRGEAPRQVRVELHRPAYFLGWQVVDYQEEALRGG